MKRVFIIVLLAAGSLTSGACVPGDVYNASNPFNEEFLLLQLIQCTVTSSCSAATSSTYMLVAVGDSDALYYSTDGTNWTSGTISGDSLSNFRKVIWNGTNFIAVGDYSTSQNIAYYSADGMTWTAATFDVLCSGSPKMEDVAFNSTRVVSVGSQTIQTVPCAYFSTDNGVSWTQSTGVLGSDYKRIVYNTSLGGFLTMVRTDSAAKAYTTTDGDTFSDPVTTPFPVGPGNATGDLHYIESTSRLVYLGQDAGPLANSSITTDLGATWTSTTTQVFQHIVTDLARATADDGSTRIVTVGDSCRMDYADGLSSGLSWIHGTTMSGCSGIGWAGLVYDGSKYYAVGNSSSSGRLAVSADGQDATWTITSTGTNGLSSITVRP